MNKKNELKISKDELIKLVEYWKKNAISLPEAKKQLGLSFTKSLAFYQRRYGIDLTLPITKDKVETIINYSLENGVPEKEACQVFGVCPRSFSQMKKRVGVPTNPKGKAPFTARGKVQYKINDNFFETPNLINCYYAGFFAADGCVHQDERVCIITLSSKDKQWLVDFGKALDFEGIVHDGITKQKFPISRLLFNSEKIVKDLKKNFNITPRKSLTLQPPKLTIPELVDAFICGYIDGDGCICLSKNGEKQKRLVISVLGTLDVVTWIKKRVCEVVGKNIGTISHKKTHSENIFSYSFGDASARKFFLKYYNMAVPKLKRKWSEEALVYCKNYHKQLPISRRKGVNVFDLNGKLLMHFETLLEAEKYTRVSFSRISELCNMNDNKHMANGFMFSRVDHMEKFSPQKGRRDWKQEREKLIREGKIKPEDFPI